MIVLWLTLLGLHQGHSRAPVNMVALGESVNFTCVNKDLTSKEVHWYKQSTGDSLKRIVTLWQSKSDYGPEFVKSRMKAEVYSNFSNLTILRTIREDEGLYHCGVTEWIKTEWTGTYLSVKENREGRTSVVEMSSVSSPVRPGDSVTLQCSVLSSSETKTCPGGHSVFWFRAGSDESPPEIIYTEGDDVGEKTDSVKSCIYRFSKNVSSSDAGTYRCAVATCGKILFGNGTKLEIATSENNVLVILTVCLALSVTGNLIFICCRTVRSAPEHFNGSESPSAQTGHGTSSQALHNTAERGEDLNYAAIRFSGESEKRGQRKKELRAEESVYSQVKYEMCV